MKTLRYWLPGAFVAAALVACPRGMILVDNAAVEVSLSLPFDPADFSPEARSTLVASVEIPGRLAISPLQIEGRSASGSFVIDIAETTSADAVFRIEGAFSSDRPRVVLAGQRVAIEITPGQELKLDVAADDFETSNFDGYTLDANANGSSNLDDLLGRPGLADSDGEPCDPVPTSFVELSTTDVQFGSGIPRGSYERRIVVLENVSATPVRFSAAIVDAPGVSVGRLASRQLADDAAQPSQLEVQALAESDLPQGEIALLSVAFAPASDYLSTGVLRIEARDRCDVVVHSSVRIIANVGRSLQPTPNGYAAARADDIPPLPELGPPQVIPAATLYSGQPFSVQPQIGLRAPDVGVQGHPADAVYLIAVPQQHNLSLVVSNAQTAIELAAFAVDSSGQAIGDTWVSSHASIGGESLSLPFVDASDVLVVVGRSNPQPDQTLAQATASFSLSAHLVGAPRFVAPPAPAEGDLFGGFEVQLRGQNFESQVNVFFGDALAGDVVVSDQGRLITCTAPVGRLEVGANPATITVDNLLSGFRATLPQAFLYLPAAPIIDSVRPSLVSTATPTPVTVQGQNFADRFGPPRVLFGAQPAANVRVVSATQLDVVAPTSSTPGPVDLRVQNQRPGSTFVEGLVPNAVTYQAPSAEAPVLVSIDPEQGDVRGGSFLVVTGQYFADGAQVTFAGRPATQTTFVSPTTLHAISPAGLAVGPVPVAVINPDAQSTAQTLPFDYTPSPAGDPLILAVNPATVHAEIAGDELTLLGDALAPTPGPSTAVVLNSDGSQSYPASLISVSAGAIRVRLDTPLPDGGGYRVQIRYGGATVDSPVFAARAPQVFAWQVVSGEAMAGRAFTLLISGDMLNPEHIFKVEIDDGGGSPQRFTPIYKSENLVRIDVGATLSQGSHLLRLIYDSGYSSTAAATLTIASDCGNGVREDGEDCDDTDLGLANCTAQGFSNGTLRCSSSCRFDTTACTLCGNGTRDLGEACDQADFGGASCATVNSRFNSGSLSCTSACTIDASACSECGNGVREAGEACDGNDLGGGSCSTVLGGFNHGALSCDASCQFVTTRCSVCGDGTQDPGEDCDGADFGGATCSSVNAVFDDGTLACTSSCTVDATACSDCGNGVIEAPYEDCDGSNITVQCSDLGLINGTVSCDPVTCRHDTSQCHTCGDGLCSVTEHDNGLCPADCPGSCGDSTCGGGETCMTCPTDCNFCAPFTATITGGGQQAIILTPLSQAIEVNVVDDQGAPVADVDVSITAPAGGWSALSDVRGKTDANGHIQAVVTLGASPGMQHIEVSVTSPDGTPVNGGSTTLSATALAPATGTIFTAVNGTGAAGSTIDASGSAVRSQLRGSENLVYNARGDLYVADTGNHRVVKIDKEGVLTVVAGTGVQGFSGDGGPATLARLYRPVGLAYDDDLDRLFIAGYNNRVRVVDAAGVIDTYAGGGTTRGDGGHRLSAQFLGLKSLAYERSSGDLYLVDSADGRIRRIDGVTGMIDSELVISTQSYPCASGGGTITWGTLSGAIALDNQGRLVFIATSGAGCGLASGNRIWIRQADGRMRWWTDRSAQGAHLGVDAHDRVYFAGKHVSGQDDLFVYRESLTRAVNPVAGIGPLQTSGDWGPGTAAGIGDTKAIAVSPSGDVALLFADGNVGSVRVVFGGATDSPPTYALAIDSGDGQSALSSRPLGQPLRALLTADGTPVAGAAVRFSCVTGGCAVQPAEVFTDTTGLASSFASVGRAVGGYTARAQAFDLFGAPVSNSVVFGFSATLPSSGQVLVLANDLGLGGAAASLPSPAIFTPLRLSGSPAAYKFSHSKLAVAPSGTPRALSLYLTEYVHHRAVEITAQGEARVLAGNGAVPPSPSVVGDGGQAVDAYLDGPVATAVDSTGRVFIADFGNDRVRVVNLDGSIETYAGGNPSGGSGHGDGLVATAANLLQPSSLAMGADDTLYIVEGADFNSGTGTGRCRVRAVDPTTQIIRTIWQNANDVCEVCGASATGASFADIYDIAVSSDNRIFIGARVAHGNSCSMSCENPTAVRACDDDALFELDGAGGAQGLERRGGYDPSYVAAHPSDGSIVFTEGHAIFRRSAAGSVTLLSGSVNSAGYLSIDAVPGALFIAPQGLIFDDLGNLYLAGRHDASYSNPGDRVRVIYSP